MWIFYVSERVPICFLFNATRRHYANILHTFNAMLKSPLWVRIYIYIYINAFAYSYTYAQKANKESRHLHKMLLTQLSPVRPTICRDDGGVGRVEGRHNIVQQSIVIYTYLPRHTIICIFALAINAFYEIIMWTKTEKLCHYYVTCAWFKMFLECYIFRFHVDWCTYTCVECVIIKLKIELLANNIADT